MEPHRKTKISADFASSETISAEAVGSAPLVESEPGKPVRLGERYEVLGLLGSGGMGSVYRVRDLELDVVVALKLMRGDWTRSAIVDRFRREVTLARRVTHRNIVRTFDVGEHGFDRFVTLELVEGESLATRIERDGRLGVRDALACAREIAEGLAAAHAVGVVHLDLKPENVLIERPPPGASARPSGRLGLPAGMQRLVITDFGISRAAEATGTQGFVGTPAYMAPEQVEGGANIDARADVYAFGALLYELLTGHTAWTGGTIFAVASARLSSPPPDPRVMRPEIPAVVADAVRAMMARQPSDRPCDGRDLVALIDATLSTFGRLDELEAEADSARLRAQRVAPTAHADRAVAVLPVRVVPDDPLLGDELTEDLIDRLSMTRALRVRHYGATRAAATHGRDARDVGRALEVDVVVELTVRHAEGAARVSARAIGVADGFQLWAQRFEANSSELLTCNDRVANAVASALSRSEAVVERAPLVEPRALELYVTARNALRQAWTGLKPFGPVLALFEDARAVAPDDPMILSGAAMARARAANYNQVASAARIEARALAERALHLAPTAPEPWFARATIDHVEGRWPEAVRSLRKALGISAGYLPAQQLLATILGEVGPLDDAILRFDVVASLDPSVPYPAIIQSQLHLLAGRIAEAMRVFPPAATWDESVGRAIYAARANLWTGDERLQVDVPPNSHPTSRLVRILVAVLHGEAPPLDALRGERDDLPRGSRFRLLLGQFVAEFASFAGRGDEALDAIEQAASDGLYDAMWLAGCPVLSSVRDTPRFEAARAVVEARAADVRAALTIPL
jgi:TolB-like protein